MLLTASIDTANLVDRLHAMMKQVDVEDVFQRLLCVHASAPDAIDHGQVVSEEHSLSGVDNLELLKPHEINVDRMHTGCSLGSERFVPDDQGSKRFVPEDQGE